MLGAAGTGRVELSSGRFGLNLAARLNIGGAVFAAENLNLGGTAT